MYTVSERDMLMSIIAVLEDDNKTDLSAILQVSKFVYEPQYEFSGIISYQHNLYASLRVPIKCRKKVQDNLSTLSNIACDLYIDDEDYYFRGINNVGILPIQTEDIEYENKRFVMEKDSIFSNFIKFVINNQELNDLQKKYLFEACECGENNNLLSATVMLGASAEMLLLDLCDAYKNYLDKQDDATKADAFEKKVVKARCAHDRLTEFLKRANADKEHFMNLGFEDINMNFNFFDIIRQTRNNSGHPTGNNITVEQFKMILTSYQHFLPIVLKAIKELNK